MINTELLDFIGKFLVVSGGIAASPLMFDLKKFFANSRRKNKIYKTIFPDPENRNFLIYEKKISLPLTGILIIVGSLIELTSAGIKLFT